MKLFAFILLTGGLLAGPLQAQEQKTIRFGVAGEYPPFLSIDENGRFHGFEIDLANALCAQLKTRCRFVESDWNDIIPALVAHRFDAILASMSITDERRKYVDFTDRYYQTPAVFAAHKASNIRDTSPSAMRGRVLGAQSATIHARHLLEVYEPAGAKVKLYTSLQEAEFELARGRLDAIFADKVGLYGWIENTDQGQCCAFAGEEVRDPDAIGDGVGIAVRKGDDLLREDLNTALEALMADGTLKAISAKYFPFSVY